MLQLLKQFWRRLTRNQKIVFSLLSSLLILGPLSLIFTPQSANISQLTMPATSPVTPPVENNPISWKTDYVVLTADDFYIIADNNKYFANSNNIQVHSDPGNDYYTTLEGIWPENGVEMRMFIYFYAEDINTVSGSAKQWGISEIRTYNGQARGDWIYYFHKIPLTAVGQTYYTDQLDLNSSPKNQYQGKIHFKNLFIKAFTPSPSPSPIPSPTPIPSPVACNTAITDFAVSVHCGGSNFRYAKYTCADNYYFTDGSPTSCQSISAWVKTAAQVCSQHPNCPGPRPTFIPPPESSPAPTALPSPKFSPSPTPVPTVLPSPKSSPTPRPIPNPLPGPGPNACKWGRIPCSIIDILNRIIRQ